MRHSAAWQGRASRDQDTNSGTSTGTTTGPDGDRRAHRAARRHGVEGDGPGRHARARPPRGLHRRPPSGEGRTWWRSRPLVTATAGLVVATLAALQVAVEWPHAFASELEHRVAQAIDGTRAEEEADDEGGVPLSPPAAPVEIEGAKPETPGSTTSVPGASEPSSGSPGSRAASEPVDAAESEGSNLPARSDTTSTGSPPAWPVDDSGASTPSTQSAPSTGVGTSTPTPLASGPGSGGGSTTTTPATGGAQPGSPSTTATTLPPGLVKKLLDLLF